ncbi:Phosphatidate cytidylyltransferase [hydrothermal vent metagenome]|uniref:Phosphatidate cytidylyltransferase n=1 Tax=hydrothermal vent metagenome TaxID=652676 RepID=A0A3B1BWA4_9ZZZZ
MTRVISGITLALLVLALLFFATPFIFFIAINVAIAICLLELYGIFEKSGDASFKTLGVVSAMATGTAIYTEDHAFTLVILGSAIVTTLSAAILSGGNDPVKKGITTLFGIFYIAVTLSTLTLIRKEPSGEFLILLLLISNSFCDIFAYYTGRTFGKTAMAPAISPKKTMEGFYGGVAGAVVGAILIKFLFLPGFDVIHTVMIGFLIGLIGPMGDLTESAIKRRGNVKDSGWIIPGHGGFLDRLDSLIFTSPLFYIYLKLFT